MREPGDTPPGRPEKRPAAFRTISEVAEDLDLPPHVLRFWESKFPQLKPLKRGGGRRYYRPEDVMLLRRIRQCLYQDGYTIRGVQKLLTAPVDPAAPGSHGTPSPSLFPLDTASNAPGSRPEGVPLSEKPAHRSRRSPAKREQPQPVRPVLEEIRRELLEARALLTELLVRGKGD